MEFGQQFRNFRSELGSFTCPKAGTWDRLFYFTSEGRHPVDFSSRKNPTASVGSEHAILGTRGTGHGNIQSYLHQFRIINSPTCPSGNNDQIINHILYNCEIILRERHILISGVEKTHKWPVDKRQ
jgi:hypothetical protein